MSEGRLPHQNNQALPSFRTLMNALQHAWDSEAEIHPYGAQGEPLARRLQFSRNNSTQHSILYQGMLRRSMSLNGNTAQVIGGSSPIRLINRVEVFSFSGTVYPSTPVNSFAQRPPTSSALNVPAEHVLPPIVAGGQRGRVSDAQLFSEPADFEVAAASNVGGLALSERSNSRSPRYHSAQNYDEEHPRPFKCPKCALGFKKLCNMKSHVDNVHEKLKLFACSLCKRAFARKSNCVKHISLVHKATVQRAFVVKLSGSKRAQSE